MKQYQNFIIYFLCLMVVGFFANFAQNEYGMVLIGFSLLFTGAILFGFAYNYIKHNLFYKIIMLLGATAYFFVLIANYTAKFEIIYLFALLYLGIVPPIILPIIIRILERKKVNKLSLLPYLEFIFLAYLCLGYFMKTMHLNGASAIFVMSSFLLIPYLIKAYRLIKLFIKNIVFSVFNYAMFYLFVSLNISAAVFGRMHWQGAKIFAYSSFVFIGLLIVSISLKKYNDTPLIKWWQGLNFINKVCLITFSITSIYWELMIHDLAPTVYSNEHPKGYEKLIEKANSITKEGIHYAERAEIYENYYDEFIEQQEAQ